MRKTLLSLVAGLGLALSQAAFADGIQVDHPWARATMGGSGNGAAYVTLTNTGSTPDKLIGVSSDAAGKTQLHQSLSDNGVMKMLPVTALELKPGEKVELKPGGYHIMLLGLKQPLVAGQSVPLTLEFEKAGKQLVSVAVEAVGRGQMGHDMHDMKDMKDMPGMAH
jgi:copper(I)-binding protein